MRAVDKLLDDGFLCQFRVLEELLHDIAPVLAHREGDEVSGELGDYGGRGVGVSHPYNVLDNVVPVGVFREHEGVGGDLGDEAVERLPHGMFDAVLEDAAAALVRGDLHAVVRHHVQNLLFPFINFLPFIIFMFMLCVNVYMCVCENEKK